MPVGYQSIMLSPTSDNLIMNPGLVLLAESLPTHCQHLKMDLKNNLLGDMGSIALAQRLSFMNRMVTLYLSLR